MQTSIEVIAALAFLITGLSHMAQPRAWVEFFVLLRGKGAAGIFMNAFLHLPMGLLIVGFHNVWTGIPAVLTVIGWGFVVKSSVYFVFPSVGMKSLSRVTMDRAKGFCVAGVIMVGLSGLLWYSLATLDDPESYIPPDKASILGDAVTAACDALDGVEDGVIDDPRNCAFDPKTLTCRVDSNNRWAIEKLARFLV